MNIDPSSIAAFARDVLGKALYPYQAEVAVAILTSIVEGRGRIFTVMMARQSGKNQLSAVLEAFLLTHLAEGTIVKAAPTYAPQITHSRLRLLTMLDAPGVRERVWHAHGNMLGLGPDHLAIQTQYLLKPISGAGYFLTNLQQTLLQGSHAWQELPRDDEVYIAGMDVAGEQRVSPTLSLMTQPEQGRVRRDSTVITIGRISYNELNLPTVEVVHQAWWTGMPYVEQYAATVALVEQWSIRTLVVDATGLGSPLASLLLARLGEQRVRPYTFTRPSKSHLAYELLALLNSGRLKLYAREDAPRTTYEECWQQVRKARYRLPEPDTLDFYVDPGDGHDDFLCSLALLTEAVTTSALPAISALVRPRPLYADDGPF
jgi:hypothetical protein